MADNDSSFVITPNGKIGKCEHFSDINLIGSVNDKTLDYKMIERFKEQHEKLAICDTCAFYPSCIRLKMCPSQIDICTEFFRKEILDNIHHMMKDCYRRFKLDTNSSNEL